MILTEDTTNSLCYMIRVDKASETKLLALQKELGLKGELEEKGNFHTTIRYIKTTKTSDLINGFLEGSKLPQLKGRAYAFDIFGPTKDTLVLRMESKEIHDWFNRFDKFCTRYGYPKSTYPTYKPHISLTIDPDVVKPKWKEKYAFEVKYNIHVVSKNYKDIWVKDASTSKLTLKESIIETFIKS
jgi:hypothetical protein